MIDLKLVNFGDINNNPISAQLININTYWRSQLLIGRSYLNIARLFFILTQKQFKSIFLLLLALPCLANAEGGVATKAWLAVKTEFTETWQSPSAELYIPINTWHNRHYYSAEKIDSFNEQPWGLGVGKYRYDEDGDWHGLYAMAFLDSHRDVEPIVGYGFQKVWRASDNVRLGVGYTAGVTFRSDSDYIPLPVLAPLFSVKYKQVALQSTYIFGGNGYGNVLFSWLRWELH